MLPAKLRSPNGNYHRAGKRFDIWRPAPRRFAGTKARKRAWRSRRDRNPKRLSHVPVCQALPASPTHRSPMLLFRLSGSFLLRFDARTFVGLLFHEPPRSVSALFP